MLRWPRDRGPGRRSAALVGLVPAVLLVGSAVTLGGAREDEHAPAITTPSDDPIAIREIDRAASAREIDAPTDAAEAPSSKAEGASGEALEPPRAPEPRAEVASAPPEPRPDRPGETPALEHASALEPFFAALERTQRGKGTTRVTHLGDSSIGMDALPHALRTRFASELGDAGPGYVYLQQESPSYRNRTVRLHAGPAWDLCVMIRRCHRDARYGLGGVSVESRGRARTLIVPQAGRDVSRAELWYLAQPSGGRLAFALGDGPEVVIDTRADHAEGRWHVLESDEPGEHSVRVRALGHGPVRAFGVVLENDEPGIVWDTLSVVGAFTHRVLAHDEAHFARQLAHRDPDLVVLNYGGNDLRRMIFGNVDRDRLEDETHRVLARVRSAVPDAGCLVMGISDHTRSGSVRV
ncbi:MAG: hypothetical protein M3Y87_34830, partial [Myxococcota bacterium]|nr:hypothetical protein [Myxococcota bacterium]